MMSVRDFYYNRKVLITGGTGFLGKVIVEKLLRDCDVNTIYLLIRPKKGISSENRLKEYWNHSAFNKVREIDPKLFEKLHPIKGDVGCEALEISESDRNELAENCEIIFHCAANVRFDLNLKDAVNFNICGTERVLKLAQQMKNLIVFAHVSTAYSQCKEDVLEERSYPAIENPYGIIDMAQTLSRESLDVLTPNLLNGFPNTYAFTKALTEELVDNYKDKIPITIARPAIITASHMEPFPGFVEGLNGPTGMMIGASRGVIRSMHCNPNYTTEIFPVDMTANAILACAWKRAQQTNNEIFYCNITESGRNPITWGDAINRGRLLIKEYPMTFALWYPDGSPKTNYYYHMFCVIFFQYLPAYFIDFLLFLFQQKPFLVKVQKRVSLGQKVLHYYTTKQWIFKNSNLLALYEQLSADEKKIFNFDISQIDYNVYLKDYFLGVRLLLKEKPETLPRARATMHKLYILDKICKLMFCALFVYIIFRQFIKLF